MQSLLNLLSPGNLDLVHLVCCYAHLPDEDTEGQRGKVTFPETAWVVGAEPGPTPLQVPFAMRVFWTWAALPSPNDFLCFGFLISVPLRGTV